MRTAQRCAVAYGATTISAFLIVVAFRWLGAIEPAFPARGEALETIVGFCLIVGIFGALLVWDD